MRDLFNDDGREYCPTCWSDDLRAVGEDVARCGNCGCCFRRDAHTGEYVRMAVHASRKSFAGRRPRR